MSHYTTRELDERLQVEVPIFDHLAELKLANIEREAKSELGGAADIELAAKHASTFPNPVTTWIDNPISADAQHLAYSHLTPMRDAAVLQFGGSGAHAVKFLLAGAKSATLLSPAPQEIEYGHALASRSGVSDKFAAKQGVGENLPFSDESFSFVFGGACLHHTDIRLSLPEIYRVLKPNGRVAFVEPIETSLYNFWVNRLGGTRFLTHGHGEIDDRPFSLEMIRENSNQFSSVELIKSGALLRYSLVPIHRQLPRMRLPVQLTRAGLKCERMILSHLGSHQLFSTVVIKLQK